MMLLYSRSYLVLSLLSMIGLALPSDVLTQRKIAKGAKKNAPPSSQREAIPVELVAPLAMPVGELQEIVTKIVFDILNDNKRRALTPKSANTFSVETTDTTETECATNYSAVAVCYDAIITIVSEGNLAAAISKLKDLLEKVIRRYGVIVSQRRGHYPYVQLKNDTPYPVPPVSGEDGGAWVWYTSPFCSSDDISEGISPGDTWMATSRGLCTVGRIYAYLTLPDNSQLECVNYHSGPGTTYSLFSIIMDGVVADCCCVKSSHQKQDCGGCPPYIPH